MSTINIEVKVNSSTASARLKHVEQQIRSVRQSTEDVAKSFKDFNRTIFAATAFIGLFSKSFNSLASAMMAGSQLDRAVNQFNNTFGKQLPDAVKQFDENASKHLGPTSQFIKLLRKQTNASVDVMSAMQAATSLQKIGVSNDLNEIVEIVARASVAGKRAGKDSAEGIRRVTNFLKDGSLAHLQHLSVIRTANPELRARLAILNQSAGVLGTTVTTQYKLNFGLKLLRDLTKDLNSEERDLRDTLLDVNQYFSLLRSTVGSLLGKAIQPLLEKAVDLSINLIAVFEAAQRNKDGLFFLGKSFLFASAAATGLILAIAGIKLGLKGLVSLVTGIPFATVAFTSLAAAVLYSRMSFDKITDSIRTFGEISKGAFQLVHSFLTDADLFSRGVGRMDESTHNFLRKKGLLGLTENLARFGAVISVFVKSAAKSFVATFDNILKIISPVTDKLMKLFGIDSGPWSRNIIENAERIGEVVGKVGAGMLGLIGVFKLFKMGKGILGGIGGLFKGRGLGSAPKGTEKDPLYVRIAGSGIGSLKGDLASSSNAVDFLFKQMFSFSKPMTGGMSSLYKNMVTDRPLNFSGKGLYSLYRSQGYSPFNARAAVKNIPGQQVSVLSNIFSILGKGARSFSGSLLRLTWTGAKIATKFSLIGIAIGTAAIFLEGFVEGLANSKEKFGAFIDGVVNWADSLIETTPWLTKLKDGVIFLYDGIIGIIDKIRNAGIFVGEWLGDQAEKLGIYLSEAAVSNIETAGSDPENVERMRKKLPKSFAANYSLGLSSTPIMPATQVDQYSMIAAAIQEVGVARAHEMVKAVREAFDPSSPGGISFTPEEWEEIFTRGIDRSKTMQSVAENTGKTKENTSSVSVGSVREGACS